MRARAALVCSILLLAACGGRNSRPEVSTYTVKRGDTLYSIAWRHDLDYRELARWNRLPADYRIHVGQVLSLRPRSGHTVSQSRASPKAAPAPAPVPIPPEERVAAWVWPTRGSAAIVRATATGSQGLLISGAAGQEVKAAAAGKVVYTGGGLRGFGQLVIVKHSNVFLSAYGHNRALKVKEGDAVNLGQPIAEMGLGPNRQPVLYFEIRLNGRPVDPYRYLPKR